MSRPPPQTRYAQSSGAKIAYQVSGTGPPDLVMVHGLISHLDLQWQLSEYRRFVRALEQVGPFTTTTSKRARLGAGIEVPPWTRRCAGWADPVLGPGRDRGPATSRQDR
jgi:hypothetical protein